MDIKVSNNTIIPVLQLKGRFDAHEISPVRDWVKAQIDAGKTRLCINLTDVIFIDSSALSTLVQGLKNCREVGGDLVLCSLPQPVRVIIELTRLDKAFRIFNSEEEAIENNNNSL